MSDDSFNMNSWMNISGAIPANSMAGMTQPYAAMPQKTPKPMQYKPVYPEIYYRLQPYIIMVCDEMDTFGPNMPSQEMIEQMTDSIYDDVCKMYPDLEKYMAEKEEASEKNAAIPTGEMYGMNRDYNHDHDHGRDHDHDEFFRRRFRRRGPFRDLIDILLLNEFFNRHRRRFY